MGSADLLADLGKQAPVVTVLLWVIWYFRGQIDQLDKRHETQLAQRDARNEELYERMLAQQETSNVRLLEQQADLTRRMLDQQKEVLPVLKEALDSSKDVTLLLDRISRRETGT